MNNSVTEKWLKCGVCNSYLDSGESYRNHFRKKHGQMKAGNDGRLAHHPPRGTHDIYLKNVPKSPSSIILSPCQVQLPKLGTTPWDYRKRPLEISDSESGSSAENKKQLRLKPASDKTRISSISTPVKNVSNESKFQCEKCSAFFTNVCQLRRHISSRHTMERPYKCDECNRRFPRSDQLKSHLRVHSDTTYYSCTQCDGKYRYLSSLNSHIARKHTPDEEKRKYPCHLCNAQFFSTQKLATHQERTHNIKKPKKYKCHLCEKFLGSSSGLQNHILMHTNEKPFKCDICNKRFCQNSNLTTHMKSHDAARPRPYACDKCDKTFIQKQHLQWHFDMHAGIKRVSCPICEKKFTGNSDLQVHIKSHVEDRPYKCDQCGKSFKHNCTLKLHIKLHLGDKPHSCDVCGKSYVQAVNLRHHFISEHSTQKRIRKSGGGKWKSISRLLNKKEKSSL